MEGNRGGMMRRLLAVGIRSTGTTPEVHPDGQVGPFDECSTHLVQVGITDQGFFRNAEDRPVQAVHLLLEHGVIGPVAAKGIGHGIVIRQKAVTRDLWPIQDPAPQITQEDGGIFCHALADVIGHNGLAVGIDGQPDIGVPVSSGMVRLDMALLCRAERPHFIELQMGDLEISHHSMMQPVACRAGGIAQPHDRIAVGAGQALGSTDGIALSQEGNHFNLFGEG